MGNMMLRIFVISGLILSCSLLGAANPTQWSKAVAQGDLEVLEKAEKNGVLPEPWKMLLYALKLEDGDSAAILYRKITTLYPNDKVFSIAQQRLQDYAAIGGILPAENIQNTTTQLPKEAPTQAQEEKIPEVSSAPTDAIVTPQPIAPPAVTPSPVGRFAAQLGAYSSEARANEIVQRLINYGYRAEVAPVYRDGKTLYRVWAGRFELRRDAQQCLFDVQNHFPDLQGVVVEIK